MNRGNRSGGSALALALSLGFLASLGPRMSDAQTATWTGAAGPDLNFWDLAINWAPGIPGTADTAVIGSSFSPIVRMGAQSMLSLQDQGGLTLEGGSLSVAASSFVSGSYAQSGGTLGGAGTLVLAGPASFTGGAIGTSSTGVVTFQNSLQISGSTTVGINNGTVDTLGITTWAGNTAANTNAITSFGGTINNTGLWLDHNGFDTSMTESCCATATFNNSGGYTKSGNSTTSFAGATLFNNTGNVNVQAGTLSLNGGGTSSGTFAIASGATLQFSGAAIGASAPVFNSATVTGPGTLTIANAVLTQTGTTTENGLLNVTGGGMAVNGTWNGNTFAQSAGTVGGTGTLTIAGAASFTGGTIGNATAGVVTFQDSLQITGNATKAINDGTVNTQGTTTWGGNTAANTNAISSFGGKINNTGTWLDQNAFDTSISEGCCATATFNNSGAYIKSGNSTTSFAGATLFNNTGNVNVQAGTLSLNGGGTSSGTFAIASGATLQFSGAATGASAPVFNSATVTGPGTLTIANAVLTQTGTTTESGLLNVTGGGLTVNGAWNGNTFAQSAGTVGGTGTLTLAGPASFTGGTIGNTTTGVVTFQNSLQITGNATKAINDGTVNTQGTTTWAGNTAANTNAISSFGGKINNTGTWLDQNAFDTSISEGCCATATFNNSGSYTKTGSGTTSLAGAVVFNNQGALAIDAGSMVMGSTFSMLGKASSLFLQIASQVNDPLQVDSTASLAGTLDLNFDFTPTTGEVITVFDYGRHTGAFDDIVGMGDAAGLALTAIYNATDMQVVVGPSTVPLPPSAWLLASGMLALGLITRGRRAGALV